MSANKYNPHRTRTNAQQATDNAPEQRNHNQHVPPATEEEQEKVNSIRELFHGRFTENGIAELLEYLNWDKREAAGFLHELRPDQDVENDDPNLKEILTRLKSRQSDGLEGIAMLAKKGEIKTANRLFACVDCNNEWWKRVPLRKQVSKCRECRVKYDPIPVELQWGWATFNCDCGNQFSGFGQMNKTKSECFNCRTSVLPSAVRQPERRGDRRSRNTHQCNAPDCMGHDHGQAQGSRGGGRGPGQGAWNQQCVHPRSRRRSSSEDGGRTRALMGSRRHVSTGSTVDTFLPQTTEKKETVFSPPLGDISEEDEGGSSGDDLR